MTSAVLRVGQSLFRFRSFTPVPVLVLLAWLLYRSRGEPGPGGAAVDQWLDAAGVAVALFGQALRFYTLGQVPEGTSGQGSVLEAVTLNTRGPYAHVRNPLYVGNLGICLGLMLVAHDPWVYAVGLGFFFGEYFFIIRAEEDFLSHQFGAAYDDYRAKVHRWIPRLSPATAGRLKSGFDWRRALKKEHNPFAAWASGALALLAWESWARGRMDRERAWVFAGAEAVVLLAFVSIKTWKRGWLRAKA